MCMSQLFKYELISEKIDLKKNTKPDAYAKQRLASIISI